MLKVVRTRRVRAIDESFYGRTARVFYVGAIRPEQAIILASYLDVAAAESAGAHQADDLRAIMRHARIPREHAGEFWERVLERRVDLELIESRTLNRHTQELIYRPTLLP